MSKVTLTRVFRGPKETKFGTKDSVAFQCSEYGAKWISTFKVTPEMKNWKEGDVVEVNISERNGFMNFDTLPNPNAGLEARVEAIEKHLGISPQSTQATSTAVKSPSAQDVANELSQGTDLDEFDF